MSTDLQEPLLDTEGQPENSHEETPDEQGDQNADNNVSENDNANANGPTTTTTTRDDGQVNPWKNVNVQLSFALCILSGVADSIWGSVVLSGFLFALGKAMGESSEDNTLVGVAEMVQGLTMLIFALPIGILADRTGKARVVRWGGGLYLVAVVVTIAALLIVKNQASDSVKDAKTAYYIMLVALGLWGICGGIMNGPSQALFSDSIPKGKRSELLTYLYSCYLISAAVGPLVGIVMLSSSNEEDWSLEEIYPVFMAGVVLEIPACLICFFFSDKYVIPEGDEEPAPPVEQQNGTADAGTGDAAGEPETLSTPWLSKAAIPYVLFCSSLIVSLGSGASVKYFPLFFKEIGLRSEIVQGIFLVVPLSISAFSFVSQRLSRNFGRVETSVAFNLCGVSLLCIMTWLSRHVDPDDTLRKVVIVIIYLLRTGIMNCPYPLLESILMDSVPSNQRARWKSLESIAAFGWTGSALLGGILSDAHSYQYTFAMTATLQLLGGSLLLIIQPLVEKEESGSSTPTEEAQEPQVSSNSDRDMEQPLLSE